MKFTEGMIFLDNFVSDKSFEVLERLTDMNDNGRSYDIKKIIFSNVKYELIDNKDDNNSSSNMTYDNSTSIRIYTDAFVGDAITFIRSISKYFADSECINTLIIGGWIYDEVNILKNYDPKKSDEYIKKYAKSDDQTYIKLIVDENIWEDFKVLVKHMVKCHIDISLQTAFKLAVIRFLEVRYDLTTRLYELDS